MKWSAEDCPYCDKDDYMCWESNMAGGYKRVKCNHTIDTQNIFSQLKKLEDEVRKAQENVDRLNEIIGKAIKE